MNLSTRLSAAFGIAAIVLLPAAALAQTSDYPVTTSTASVQTGENAVVVDDTLVVDRTGTFVLSAGGFLPGGTVTVTIFSDPVDLGMTSADASGNIEFVVDLPDDFPAGEHSIVASGDAPDGGTVRASIGMVVLPAADFAAVVAAGDLGASDVLAQTGLDAGLLAGIAGTAVAAGAGSLAVARRRRG